MSTTPEHMGDAPSTRAERRERARDLFAQLMRERREVLDRRVEVSRSESKRGDVDRRLAAGRDVETEADMDSWKVYQLGPQSESDDMNRILIETLESEVD